jgi:hypothetical protein
MLRLRRVGRGDRGASAVEFAIVVPVLLLILLGIIEFAFVLRDANSVSSSVGVAARIASTAAAAGPAECPSPLPPGVSTCGPADTPQLAQVAADAIQRAGTAMNQDNIDEIWVYRANSAGYAANAYYVDSAHPNVTAGTNGATSLSGMLSQGCNVACVKYRWIDSQNRFRYVGGTWDSTKTNACIRDVALNPPDAVGVYMRATHPFFTGFFQRSLTLDDRAVMQFEPLPTQECNNLGTQNGGHI